MYGSIFDMTRFLDGGSDAEVAVGFVKSSYVWVGVLISSASGCGRNGFTLIFKTVCFINIYHFYKKLIFPEFFINATRKLSFLLKRKISSAN